VETLKTAKKLGIPTVLERPNAHTRFAFETVGREFQRLGIIMPPDDEYSFKADLLNREEEEYRLADYILCPSDFTVRTFLDQGIPPEKLKRHIYGYDEKAYFPNRRKQVSSKGLDVLFVGVCAVRKGVHFALESWLNSPASRNGTFRIAGGFLPAYAEHLSSMLSHPSVKVLGHRDDVPELMRKSDILVLPSIEEGFGLVVAEAMGSGCVPLISEACTDICRHMVNGLVHPIGDVKTLEQHITMLHGDRKLLQKLRESTLKMATAVTWTAAGRTLLQAYQEIISSHSTEG
jgi:glycosyltransferase involved in cell wall biosynthesis